MTKKHFIELADYIREFNNEHYYKFTDEHLDKLANFCEVQNPRFDRELWLGYIAGTRGLGGKYLEATK